MSGFIDIHTHILFGVDDGAENLEDSMALIRAGIKEGITTFFLTPHLYTLASIERERIKENFQILRKKVEEQKVPCQLYLGGEVNYTHQLFEVVGLDIGAYQTNGKVILLEFPHDMLPFSSFNVLKKLVASGYQVVVAHPERNYGILTNFKHAVRLKEAGCLLQLTTTSITGGFGGAIQKTALQMIKKGLADFVASDAHSLVWRPFNFRAAYEKVQEGFGRETADFLFKNNQLEKILPGR